MGINPKNNNTDNDIHHEKSLSESLVLKDPLSEKTEKDCFRKQLAFSTSSATISELKRMKIVTALRRIKTTADCNRRLNKIYRKEHFIFSKPPKLGTDDYSSWNYLHKAVNIAKLSCSAKSFGLLTKSVSKKPE